VRQLRDVTRDLLGAIIQKTQFHLAFSARIAPMKGPTPESEVSLAAEPIETVLGSPDPPAIPMPNSVRYFPLSLTVTTSDPMIMDKELIPPPPIPATALPQYSQTAFFAKPAIKSPKPKSALQLALALRECYRESTPLTGIRARQLSDRDNPIVSK
jgi:hypothetical protein